MKKRIKFLSFISSILAVVSICGLSLFSLLDHKKETQKVSAEGGYVTLANYNGNFGIDVINDDDEDYELRGTYDVSYNHFLESSNSYGWSVSLTYYMFLDGDTPYFLYRSYEVPFSFANNIGLRDEILDFSRLSLKLVVNSVGVGRLSPLDNTSLFVQLDLSLILYQVTPNINGGTVEHSFLTYDFESNSIGGCYALGFLLPWTYGATNFNAFGIDGRLFSVSSIVLNYTDFDEGYSEGYESGYNTGYGEGVAQGYQSGYESGVIDGASTGYAEGYSVGFNEGVSTNGTAITIMSGIFQVALVPINFFLGMFNFNILGVNLANLIQAIFTIAITIILVKAVIGSKGD